MEAAGANRRWRYQFRYRGSHRESAVTQFSTLIWLHNVKRAIVCFPKIFIFQFASPRTILSQQPGRHDCGFNAEMREPTRLFSQDEVIDRSRSEAALSLCLGSRISPTTAGLPANEERASCLTGSRPLVQNRFVGAVIFFLLVFY